MQNLVGQSLGRYQIVTLLGEGGMGAVFKARDITLQRDVAVKVMHPHLARQPNFQERFLQEARTAARMNHPGIVQVYDFGQARGHLYIVMEFIPGATLRQMLKNLKTENQRIVLTEALQLVRQISLALDYVHHQGVLHRDIKPNNIMIKPEPSEDLPYRPVLTDLGLAKLLEGGLITQEGISMGTPAYMSPEQALGEETDVRSDVYSLGILLYELVVGQLPFPAKTISEAIRYHVKESPPPPRSIRPDLPQPVERVILQAIEKNPAHRFPNAQALAAALAGTVPEVAATDVSTALEGTGSLMTQYQTSLVAPRGPSILDEFPAAPLAEDQGGVVVLAPDRSTRSFPIKPGGLTIGRARDNDVVLDSPTVSPHHARIEFDGTAYHVTDLDSLDGTHLADAKLLPGVPEVWPPLTPLRIGDYWLRLEEGARASAPARVAPLSADSPRVDSRRVRTGPGEGKVVVGISPTQLTVKPGSSITASITIHNQGPVVDHFQVSVEGIPTEWMSPPLPPTIPLMPDEKQTVTLTIRPPRTPQSQAASHSFTVCVGSRDEPDRVVKESGALVVAPYSQFSSELHPKRVRAGQAVRVTVENQGNLQEPFTVRWKDLADELVFKPSATPLSVPPGKTAVATFHAAPRQRRWIGGDLDHPFMIQVRSPGGEVQSHNGEVVSRGRIPIWALSLVMFLGLLLCLFPIAVVGIGPLLTGQGEEPPAPTSIIVSKATSIPTPTRAPTQTPLPTPTLTAPAPFPVVGSKVRVFSEEDGELNIRQGPGVKYPILRVAYNGDWLQILAGPEDTDQYSPWYEVRDLLTGKIQGWCSGKYLVLAPVTPTTLERIEFQSGGTTFKFTTTLTNGQIQGYVLRALAGQRMYIEVSNSTLDVTVLDLDPENPAVSLDTRTVGRWEFSLKVTGDYTILLEGTGRTTVSIEIPPR